MSLVGERVACVACLSPRLLAALGFVIAASPLSQRAQLT